MRLPSSGIPAGSLIQIRAQISAGTGQNVSQADVKAQFDGPSKVAANKRLSRAWSHCGAGRQMVRAAGFEPATPSV